MKRNFDAPMIDIDGNPYTDNATLKTIAIMALRTPLESDQKSSDADKVAIYLLAVKIANGGVVDLSVNELALLKKRIGATMFPLVVGKSWEMLEQDFVETEA